MASRCSRSAATRSRTCARSPASGCPAGLSRSRRTSAGCPGSRSCAASPEGRPSVATRRLPDGPDGRAQAARVLADGGVVAFPTDTVYGIAVALHTPGGIERLFAAKQRPLEKAIALLVADASQAAELGELN